MLTDVDVGGTAASAAAGLQHVTAVWTVVAGVAAVDVNGGTTTGAAFGDTIDAVLCAAVGDASGCYISTAAGTALI